MTIAAPIVVAFDLGGVVVDVDLAVLLELGPRERVDAAFFGHDRHERLSVGTLSAGAFCADVAADLDVSADDVATCWRRVVGFSAGGLELVESTARRHPVLIWSNTDPLHWSVLGPALTSLATTVSPSFRVGHMKPEAAYFARALDAAGADTANRVVFVDDRADNVAAATGLGINAVVVRGVAAARAAIDSAVAMGLSR
jgi:FMN phosphatase YigB (HAD superfamily)